MRSKASSAFLTERNFCIGFDHHICHVDFGLAVLETTDQPGDQFSNEMMTDMGVFHSFVEDRIFSDLTGSSIDGDDSDGLIVVGLVDFRIGQPVQGKKFIKKV